MTTDRATTLVRLSDAGKTVADPAVDIRGRAVRDRSDKKLGTIEDLLVDPVEGKVRFLRVEHGGIFGFGATPSFVPVEAIARVEPEEIHIDQSTARVAQAPRYDPDLVDESETNSVAYYGSLYSHYGYVPFWTPGRVPPPETPTRRA